MTSWDEDARLAALAEYDLDGATPDESTERIVRLAAAFFGLPIVSISLIDGATLFSHCYLGLSVNRMDRSGTLCLDTVTRNETVVFLDASRDPRSRDNPSVTGNLGVRFYAGVPLRGPGGHAIGAFCVVDTRPREAFGLPERRALEDFAALVMTGFDLRRVHLRQRGIQERFERMAATSPDGMVVADERGRILSWNAGAERIFGYTAEQAAHLTLLDLLPAAEGGDMAARFGPGLGTSLEAAAAVRGGAARTVECSVSRWEEAGRTVYGAVLRDVSERRSHERTLHRLAHHDNLTGLANRAVLCAALSESLATERSISVLLVDLDGFKEVNDTLGHSAGDHVLEGAARRLLGCIGPGDMVARLGGDEFAILLAGRCDPLEASRVAHAVIERLSEPFSFDEQAIHLGASIGIALGPVHAGQTDDLLSCADLALYRAKADGRRCFRLFTAPMRELVGQRRRHTQDLRRAAEQGEFVLFYQPQVRLSDGAITGAEALIRWQHPRHGLLQPGAFLPALDASRYAAGVHDWVIRTACEQAAVWRERGAPDFRIGVNLSGTQFRSGTLATAVLSALAAAGLPAECLELEITESIALRPDEDMLAPLRLLRAAGVGIAFDDYGTGYASLSLLKRLPLTRLKIDRSFVHESEQATDSTVIRAILDLARGFSLRVIAEGIETDEQRHRLERMGCPEGQGFLFGWPMSAAAFERRLLRTARYNAA